MARHKNSNDSTPQFQSFVEDNATALCAIILIVFIIAVIRVIIGWF